jgi:hypothetical protein
MFKDPRAWPTAAHAATTQTTRYGAAQAQSWDQLHPKLTHRGTWADHDGDVPIIEGTVIRLQVDRLPGDGTPKPLWLWFSATAITPASMDRLWQMFLRRFDLEHTFRFLKQTLGWTRPRLRSPEAADRWTWLIITAHTQLRLARGLIEDQPRPWEPRTRNPRRLTPARVRRGFRNIRPTISLPAVPALRNPPDPVQAAHLAHRTSTALPCATSERSPKRTQRPPQLRSKPVNNKLRHRTVALPHGQVGPPVGRDQLCPVSQRRRPLPAWAPVRDLVSAPLRDQPHQLRELARFQAGERADPLRLRRCDHLRHADMINYRLSRPTPRVTRHRLLREVGRPSPF